MKPPRKFKSLLLTIVLSVLPLTSSAVGPELLGDIAKAQVILGKVNQIRDQFLQLTVELKAPAPRNDAKGKYLLPYLSNGEPAEWASKVLQAQAGKVVGEKAGNMAANALASKVPFGGLAGGLMKKKVKESAAVAALGGMKFIKKNSDQSFKNLNDYAVYLHVTHSSDPEYQMMLASAVALYPALEHRFPIAIQQAYRKQAK